MDEERNHEESFELIAQKMLEFGDISVKLALETDNKLLLTRGNILRLIGGLLTNGGNESDIYELEAFLSFFTAKKLLEQIPPAQLLMAKSVGDNPLMDMMGGMPGGSDIMSSLQDMMENDEGFQAFLKDLGINNDDSDEDILGKYLDKDKDE